VCLQACDLCPKRFSCEGRLRQPNRLGNARIARFYNTYVVEPTVPADGMESGVQNPFSASLFSGRQELRGQRDGLHQAR
jgi:hypothetical protein